MTLLIEEAQRVIRRLSKTNETNEEELMSEALDFRLKVERGQFHPLLIQRIPIGIIETAPTNAKTALELNKLRIRAAVEVTVQLLIGPCRFVRRG